MQGNFTYTQKKNILFVQNYWGFGLCPSSDILFVVCHIQMDSVICCAMRWSKSVCCSVFLSSKLTLNDYTTLFMYWIILHAHWEISPQHFCFSSPSILACNQIPPFVNWSACMIMATCMSTWPSCGMQQWKYFLQGWLTFTVSYT
jgi:hypothetical protein